MGEELPGVSKRSAKIQVVPLLLFQINLYTSHPFAGRTVQREEGELFGKCQVRKN